MRHASVKATGGPTVQLVDVLERVLTKGIVIVYDGDVSLLGLHAIEIEGHATVMSLETFARVTEPPPASETESSEALITAVDEYLRRLPPGNIADTP